LSNDWTLTRRVAFRFGVVYLTLFCLVTQISGSLIPNPWVPYRDLGRLWPVREITPLGRTDDLPHRRAAGRCERR
jgi:hypothetical protein